MTTDPDQSQAIEGQLNARERELLSQAILGTSRQQVIPLSVLVRPTK
jgi:hypothetical protein